jgi:site-specific DNA recombinase
MIYILIARVSTAIQRNSLEAQQSAARAWAARTGNEVVIDERFIAQESGVTKNRESVQLALEEIRAGRAHGIVVTKLDRLSRSLEELIKIMSDVRAAQGAFVCIDQPIDTTTPAGELFFHMMGAIAQFERELIRERGAAVRAERKAQGMHISGTVPYGWTKREDGKLIQCEREQDTIKRIRDLREDGVPWRTITLLLNERRVPSKTGKKWHERQVRRVVEHG